MRQQELQCNLPSELRVVGAIDDPHSTGAERLLHIEVRDRVTRDAEQIGLSIELGQNTIGRYDVGAGFCVRLQQRLERTLQLGVAATECGETICARVRRQLDEGVETRLDFLPALRVHRLTLPGPTLRAIATKRGSERRSQNAGSTRITNIDQKCSV